MIKVCVVCGVEFDAKNFNAKVCGVECRAYRRRGQSKKSKKNLLYKERQKEYSRRPDVMARRRAQAKDKVPVYKRVCIVCGVFFTCRGRSQRKRMVCSDVCRKIKDNMLRYPNVYNKDCIICGVSFTTKNHNIITCSSSCSTKRKNNSTKKLKRKHKNIEATTTIANIIDLVKA